MKKGDEIKVSGERGTVLRVKDGVAYVQMDRPLHFMDTPDEIDIQKITTKMVHPRTDTLGYGTAQFLDLIGKLPAGTWTDSGLRYHLKKPMKLSVIEGLCMDEHGDEPHCWLQSAYLNIIPIQV